MHESPSSPTAIEWLVSIGRRWRIVVPFAVVTPLVVLLLTSPKPPTYSSSAEVLLSRQGLILSGLQDATLWTPGRTIRTQAKLARLPEVADRVVVAAGLSNRSPFGFLAQSSVVASGQTDFMTFLARSRDPELASKLATIYAEQYIEYRRELDTRSLRNAIDVLSAQVGRARAQGADPTTYADLIERQQQLHTALASVAANAILVRPAGDATRIGPHPLRESFIALALGLIVGLGIAALSNMLDARARTADEISDQLGLPLLGRLPREPRERLRPNRPPTFGAPRLEAVRALRTNLELEGLHDGPKVVMVTSSVAGEGKSTTIAQLSVALALAGHDVTLVDLDFRRPTVARLFDLPRSPGIVDLVRGTATVEDVMRESSLEGQLELDQPRLRDDARTAGRLRVVTAGTLPVETTEILAGSGLPAALESLRGLSDVVLVDSPPLLQSSDSLVLTTVMDAIVFVANTQTYRGTYAREIKRLLTMSPARVLGLVVIGRPGELESTRTRTYRELGRSVRALGPA